MTADPQSGRRAASGGGAARIPIAHFPLLRRLSIGSLLALLVTAGVLILMYRHEQFAEHHEVVVRENQRTAQYLMRLLGRNLDFFMANNAGLDGAALRANPDIGLLDAPVAELLDSQVLKIKLYNLSGIVVYSSLHEEIGGTTRNHPALLAGALKGSEQHRQEFRDSFRGHTGELFDRHIVASYMPMRRPDGALAGVFELYSDITPVARRIESGILNIALIVAGVFAVLYAALFFSVRSADHALARWREAVAEGGRREREGAARLRAMLDSALDGVIGIDATGCLIELNPAAEEMFGWRLHEVQGQQMSEVLIPERFRARHREGLTRFLQTREGKMVNRRIEISALRSDGTEFPVELSITTIRQDGLDLFIAYARDITQRKRIEEELRIAAIAFDSQEGMFITDARGVILRVNQAFVDTTGYSAAEAVGRTAALLRSGRHDAAFYATLWAALSSDGYWQGEIWNRRKNGEIYPEWLTITGVRNDEGVVTHHVAAFSDITQRKVAEEEIKHLAFYDPLTRLPNRRLLLDRLRQALAVSERSRLHGALLFIDLDNFKALNDSLGHDVGDCLLQQVATRLQECVREGDTVARLGGDEFVLMLEDLSDRADAAAALAENVGEKILKTLNQVYQLGSHEYHSTPSIGVTLYQGNSVGLDELLKRADLAMFQAKTASRNTMRFFDPKMQATVTARCALENDLRQAIRDRQFVLFHQPQVDAWGRVTGAEALVRWQHPQRGLVLPAEFIPLAEESGLILPLGQWVLETACATLAEWGADPDTADRILAVNISARQFHQDDFVAQVLDVLEHSGANPYQLKLELTESVLLNDVDDTIAKMEQLKARGVSFSLDDFGTGYSSLAYLKRLPLDQLKIDRSFVQDVLLNPNDAVIARSIIALGNNLGLSVMAEGVETEAQREFLTSNHCHAFQGYLFGKPAVAVSARDAAQTEIGAYDGLGSIIRAWIS